MDRRLGGAKLANMEIRDKALKIVWIFKNDYFVQNVIAMLLPEKLGTMLWECQLKEKKEIEQVIKINELSEFWKQVVTHWFQLTWKQEKEFMVNEIMYQVIWYNSHIRVGGKLLKPCTIKDNNVKYVKDLISDDGKWHSYHEYGSSLSWLHHKSICEAIPKQWVEKIRLNNAPIIKPVTIFETLSKAKKPAKIIYELIIKNVDYVKSIFEKIKKDIDVREYDVYKKGFDNIYKVTNVTKYRDFQYRLMTNVIFANNRLYYWKKVESQKCDWCEDKQTVKHLLYECKQIGKIWDECKEFVTECMYVKERCDFSYKSIFLNEVHPEPAHIVNFLILVAKQRIHAKKCLQEKPTFIDILNKFEQLHRIEKYNAKKHNKLNKHNKKWAPYIETDECLTTGEGTENIEDYITNYVMNFK